MNDDFYFNVKKKRPEEYFDSVFDYFKGERLAQYANSKSMMRIQERITTRALKLLKLEKRDSLILDAGCGPGFTSIFLKELGYNVVALDIIPEFFNFYDIKEFNPLVADMCFPPFKPKSFDGIISISALQWVFREINNQAMRLNLINMARTFFEILKPSSNAVIQFYPKSQEIAKEIGKIIADNTDFTGNFVMDNPNNPKKRKIFLLLKKK